MDVLTAEKLAAVLQEPKKALLGRSPQDAGAGARRCHPSRHAEH